MSDDAAAPSGRPPLSDDLGAAVAGVIDELERRVAALLEEHRRAEAVAAMDPEPLWDVRRVAKRLGVSERTVEKLIALRELTPLRIGGQRRFDPRTVEAYVRRCAAPPANGKDGR